MPLTVGVLQDTHPSPVESGVCFTLGIVLLSMRRKVSRAVIDSMRDMDAAWPDRLDLLLRGSRCSGMGSAADCLSVIVLNSDAIADASEGVPGSAALPAVGMDVVAELGPTLPVSDRSVASGDANGVAFFFGFFTCGHEVWQPRVSAQWSAAMPKDGSEQPERARTISAFERRSRCCADRCVSDCTLSVCTSRMVPLRHDAHHL